MDLPTWEKAQLEDAKVIVSTIPVETISEKILDLGDDTDKIIRADRMNEAAKFIEDSEYVEVPDLLASERLADHITGVLDDKNYKSELRRRNLLEIRKLLNEEEE